MLRVFNKIAPNIIIDDAADVLERGEETNQRYLLPDKSALCLDNMLSTCTVKMFRNFAIHQAQKQKDGRSLSFLLILLLQNSGQHKF